MKVHEKKTTLLQFIKFGIVGLSNTVLSYLLYVFVLWLLQYYGVLKKYDYFIASVIAFVLTVFWSFYWNNRFTFPKQENVKRNTWKALVKTYVSYSSTGLILSNVLLYVQVEMMGMRKLIAPIINLFITVPINYLLNKYWAFKEG